MPKHGISGASRQRHWRPETEESWRSAMLRTTSPGLNWAFWLPGPASWAGALAQRLQPAANTRLVVAVGVAEAPLEIGLLACDHAVAHSDGERQREDKNPWAGRLQADAGIDEKHAGVDGIAAPGVYAGCHQRPHRLIGGHRRRCAREVANSRRYDCDTKEDQTAAGRPKQKSGLR